MACRSELSEILLGEFVCRLEILELDVMVAVDMASSTSLSENDSGHHATLCIMRRYRGTGARRQGMHYDGYSLVDNVLASCILKTYEACSSRSTLRSLGLVRLPDGNCTITCAVQPTSPYSSPILLLRFFWSLTSLSPLSSER